MNPAPLNLAPPPFRSVHFENDSCLMRIRPFAVLPAKLADFFYAKWKTATKNDGNALFRRYRANDEEPLRESHYGACGGRGRGMWRVRK